MDDPCNDPYAGWVPGPSIPTMLPPSNYPYPPNYGVTAAGSASSPIAVDSQPKTKRARKTKDPNTPAPEKRGAVFKKACPQNIMERAMRVVTQRCVLSVPADDVGKMKFLSPLPQILYD